MSAVDHVAEATFLLVLLDQNHSDFDREMAMKEAHVHAMLAVAEQTRLGNQIAYLAICEQRGAKDAGYHELDAAVREGLGLA